MHFYGHKVIFFKMKNILIEGKFIYRIDINDFSILNEICKSLRKAEREEDDENESKYFNQLQSFTIRIKKKYRPILKIDLKA